MTFPTSKQIAKVIDLLVFGMEETAAEESWTPRELERVIYWNDDFQEYRTAFYVALWNDMRGLRSADDNREGKFFEASPYHYECLQNDRFTIRARVIDELTGYGQYADIELIAPATAANIEYAFSQNMAVA